MESSQKDNETSSYLPMDIIMPVLKILPVKALVRFLCVSKTFSSMILKFTPPAIPNCNQSSNCLFSINYNSPKHTLKLHLEGESPAFDFDLPYRTKQSRIVSSWDGVLCVMDDYPPHSIFLWNPSIRKSVRLPNPDDFHTFGLLALGSDPTRDDYKLVWICNRQTPDHHHPVIMLYSLRSNIWRSHSEIPPHDLLYYSIQYIVFMNGACHWLLMSSSLTQVIFTFHMRDEVFGQLAMPPLDGDHFNGKLAKLVVFKGLLSLVPLEFSTSFPIWAMVEYGNPKSWTKLFSIDLGFVSTDPTYQFIGYRGNSEDILISDDSNLLMVKPETQKMQKVNEIDVPRNFDGFHWWDSENRYWGTYRESFGLMDVKHDKTSPVKRGRKDGWIMGRRQKKRRR